jgi:hypothetical protein
MRRLSLVCAVAFCLGLAARAEPARVWNFDDNPEGPSLGYGLPASDDVLIVFSCDPDARRMTIVESIEAKNLNPGGTATFRLTVGTQSLDLTGDAIANESDGTVSIEVKGAPNPRLFALLKGGPTLTIEVGGTKDTVPLAGAAPHIAAFEKLCLGRK